MATVSISVYTVSSVDRVSDYNAFYLLLTPFKPLYGLMVQLVRRCITIRLAQEEVMTHLQM